MTTKELTDLPLPKRKDIHVEWSDNYLGFTCPCDDDPETEDDRDITLSLSPFENCGDCTCKKCGRKYESFPEVIVTVTCNGKAFETV